MINFNKIFSETDENFDREKYLEASKSPKKFFEYIRQLRGEKFSLGDRVWVDPSVKIGWNIGQIVQIIKNDCCYLVMPLGITKPNRSFFSKQLAHISDTEYLGAKYLA
ncbi:Uncharacterised protein [uncultured archaeon]|nr:Uncharacterised protein [uncultured archaeon]